jgi:hypothetical protein
VTSGGEGRRLADLPAPLPWIVASLLFVGSILVFGRLAQLHLICTYSDADFYGSYAPDAERIAAGRFPVSRFQGPGYPVLLALVRPLAGDLFTAGKAIAVVSAGLSGLFAFVLFRNMWGDIVGLGAQLLLLTSPLFVRLAVEPVTDMPFLMLCLAALTVFLSSRFQIRWRVGCAAALAGLACLTRYNGVFLLAAFAFSIVLLNLFETGWRERLDLLALLILVSLAVAAPWLYANHWHRGNPFYNDNYLNIATAFYGRDFAEGTLDGKQAITSRFHSFRDVVAYDPVRLITHYPVNLATSLLRSLGSWRSSIAPLAGLVIAWRAGRTKRVVALLLAVAALYLLMALNHFEARYYLFATAFFSALSALALQTIAAWLAGRLRLRLGTPKILAGVALVLVAVFTAIGAARLLRRMYSEEPREIFGACAYLRDRGIHDSPMLVYKPHVPFVCGQEAVYMPRFAFEPAMERWIVESRAQFLVIGPEEVRRRPQLGSWRDPARAPAWLRPLWSQGELFLYEIRRADPSPTTP